MQKRAPAPQPSGGGLQHRRLPKAQPLPVAAQRHRFQNPLSSSTMAGGCCRGTPSVGHLPAARSARTLPLRSGGRFERNSCPLPSSASLDRTPPSPMTTPRCASVCRWCGRCTRPWFRLLCAPTNSRMICFDVTISSPIDRRAWHVRRHRGI